MCRQVAVPDGGIMVSGAATRHHDAVKGAATGITSLTGRFKDADGGTIFLDEIGDIPEAVQLKLLKAIQDGEIEPVGKKSEKVDVRVIAATNHDLEARVREGKFREELYHRLKVFEISMPPLARHKEDIPRLAEYFASRKTDATAHEIVGFTSEAKRHLSELDYENNIRGLENIIKRACKYADLVIDIKAVCMARETMGDGIVEKAAGAHAEVDLSRSTMEDIERAAIQCTLQRTGGNKKAAAESLGIAEASIYNKIRKYEH